MSSFKLIGYPLAAALLVSSCVLLLACLLLGFRLSEWGEWEGRMVGIAATTLAVVAAGIGYARAREKAEPE